jgi:hypothetical protein
LRFFLFLEKLLGAECAMNNGRRILIDHVRAFFTPCATRQTQNRLFSSKTFPILDNRTMSAAIESNSFAIYIGTTAHALKEEDLRFLTERGAQDQRGSRSGRAVYTGQRNRHVLVYPNTGMSITMKEARE